MAKYTVTDPARSARSSRPVTSSTTTASIGNYDDFLAASGG